MRNNNLTPIVILALNLDSEEMEQQAISRFIGKEYTRPSLVGCYKGEDERSYIIDAVENNLDEILDFAKQYNQESILHLDNQRLATLIFDRDNSVSLGRFKSVSESNATSRDAYTYNPVSNTYYIAE